MSHPAYLRSLQKRLARRQAIFLAGSAGAALALAACGKSTSSGTRGGSTGARPDGWTDATHSKDADPNYDVVFPADKVLEVAITVSRVNWQKMLDDMTALFGARGTGNVRGGGAPQGGAPQGGGVPQAGGGFPGGPGGGGDFTSTNPVWVPGTVAFNGKTWTNVGVRFKGNSTLANAWRSGVDKMPLKLDFDEFEDDFPEIRDQRFYGFKQFSLSNNQNDPSFMREATAYSILEDAGLVAARTATWLLTFDHGEGAKKLGLYTAIEVVDDTVIERCFKDSGGNIYEGDGRAASFAVGTQGQIEASFQVEGGDNPDWSDIKALYGALHATNRTTDAAAWRKGLEAVFDVDAFLEWLGIAAALQHWDTYGSMSHNYFLYNNPENGKLNWISWDHNEVLGSGMGGGGGQVRQQPGGGGFPAGNQPGGGFAGRGNVSFDKSGVTDEWPLISFLMSQPEYLSRYNSFLKQTVALFDTKKLSARYEARAAVLKPYIGTDTNASGFASAVQSLTAATEGRETALKEYVATL